MTKEIVLIVKNAFTKTIYPEQPPVIFNPGTFIYITNGYDEMSRSRIQVEVSPGHWISFWRDYVEVVPKGFVKFIKRIGGGTNGRNQNQSSYEEFRI